MDLSKALEYCRKLKIIHRDIKPENIFVSRFGDFKLGDFGIARELERTMSGFSKKGTYSYMAPEMYKGEKYDSRVDIYSLGIVLYRLMNHNRLPFMSLEKQFITYRDKENALNKRVAGEQMSAPVDAGTQFARIIMKACAYDPAQRYQTPEELYSALDDLKNGRSGRIRQLQNGVQKAGTDKTESYSAIAQNGRAAQNVTSDAENVRKSTVQNTSVQNTRGNKKTSDFQNAAKRKRAVNNVSESNFTDKETMSVVAEQTATGNAIRNSCDKICACCGSQKAKTQEETAAAQGIACNCGRYSDTYDGRRLLQSKYRSCSGRTGG